MFWVDWSTHAGIRVHQSHNKISRRYQYAKNSLRKHFYADKPRRTSSVSTLSKRAGPRPLPPQRHQLRMRLIRTRSPGSCSTVLPLVPEGFGFSTTAPASQRRPYPRRGQRIVHNCGRLAPPRLGLPSEHPNASSRTDVRALPPLAASEQADWTTPPSYACTPPRTRTHHDLPRRAPSPMAYSSLVCTPAPNTGGLLPGNQPTSRLHCQARRHSPPPDASTKLCCSVPKEPQPDDDGRNLTLISSPSRRSAEGRSTERAVPATGSAGDAFGGHNGELFRCAVTYGRPRMGSAEQVRGDRSSQERRSEIVRMPSGQYQRPRLGTGTSLSATTRSRTLSERRQHSESRVTTAQRVSVARLPVVEGQVVGGS